MNKDTVFRHALKNVAGPPLPPGPRTAFSLRISGLYARDPRPWGVPATAFKDQQLAAPTHGLCGNVVGVLGFSPIRLATHTPKLFILLGLIFFVDAILQRLDVPV